MQEAVYVILSNTHAPLQPNQTAKVSADGVQEQAKYLSAILFQWSHSSTFTLWGDTSSLNHNSPR